MNAGSNPKIGAFFFNDIKLLKIVCNSLHCRFKNLGRVKLRELVSFVYHVFINGLFSLRQHKNQTNVLAVDNFVALVLPLMLLV